MPRGDRHGGGGEFSVAGALHSAHRERADEVPQPDHPLAVDAVVVRAEGGVCGNQRRNVAPGLATQVHA